jgi:FtsZ-binding cell division protein ZapB
MLVKKNNKNLKVANKKLKQKVKYLEAEWSKLNSAKEVLEQEVRELQKTVNNIKENLQSLNVVPVRHQYPIGVIYLYISLVLNASTSLRGASKSLEVFMSTLNFDCSTPSWPCGRLWLLRLGYYKLTSTKEKSEDWIWLADHVIQLGEKKCFVIYGVRQSHLSNIDRALTYKDLEPLAILPVTKSSGEIVFNQLEQTIEQTGVPREIVGDHGSDIKKGIDEFCQEHPKTDYIHDIKHKRVLILKHEFEKDEVWLEFT